jgi:hypothetical protein
MRSQIAKRDFPPIAAWDSRARGREVDHRLVQLYFAAVCHLRQEEDSEELGDRAYLEDGCFVDTAAGGDVAAALRCSEMAFPICCPDNHASAQPMVIHAGRQAFGVSRLVMGSRAQD